MNNTFSLRQTSATQEAIIACRSGTLRQRFPTAEKMHGSVKTVTAQKGGTN